MISARLQIEQLEKAQLLAFQQGDEESHARITAMLKPLYEEREAIMRDRVKRFADQRHGLPAHRVFSEQDRISAIEIMNSNQLPSRAN